MPARFAFDPDLHSGYASAWHRMRTTGAHANPTSPRRRGPSCCCSGSCEAPARARRSTDRAERQLYPRHGGSNKRAANEKNAQPVRRASAPSQAHRRGFPFPESASGGRQRQAERATRPEGSPVLPTSDGIDRTAAAAGEGASAAKTCKR
ncbi:hypothetical protein HPB50_015196 [Hyalomma asiaticum]|uniref:Uncharacterized protein n=1 Tax=Hyalomma asiaticum TaxID=266040 RepID=A0ACB7SQF5_HYAAI|nr:hypothetical protein HPB50_015196 [Hyalomma asiaticum]